jgi:hypothetical protein
MEVEEEEEAAVRHGGWGRGEERLNKKRVARGLSLSSLFFFFTFSGAPSRPSNHRYSTRWARALTRTTQTRAWGRAERRGEEGERGWRA